ncbi:hypothetical protein FF041_13195, partial [Streptomyces jumonjinensis]|nr:hypothetical protein [Streptomyces jumonjinensis]
MTHGTADGTADGADTGARRSEDGSTDRSGDRSMDRRTGWSAAAGPGRRSLLGAAVLTTTALGVPVAAAGPAAAGERHGGHGGSYRDLPRPTV